LAVAKTSRIREQHIVDSERRCARNNKTTRQAVFAVYLNISLSTIQKWERGQKKPSGASLKLLDLVDRKGLEFMA